MSTHNRDVNRDHSRLTEDLALLAAGHDTGFWDETGRRAPWPDDIDGWSPVPAEPITLDPGEQPF